jgi:hypothetical protein
MQTTTYKNEWLQPEPWEKLLPGVAAVGLALAKLKEQFSKRGKPSKRNLKKLGTEIDALQKDLEQLVELLTKYFSTHEKFVNAFVGLLATLDKAGLAQTLGNSAKIAKIVIAYDKRLSALEATIRKKPVPATEASQ